MVIAAVITRWLVHGHASPTAVDLAWSFALVNLFLGLFNLVPIPPLDGAAILERAMPREWLPAWNRFRPYGLLVLMLLVFTVGFGSVFKPFIDHLRNYVAT
jgi:Zn-dependent protease